MKTLEDIERKQKDCALEMDHVVLQAKALTILLDAYWKRNVFSSVVVNWLIEQHIRLERKDAENQSTRVQLLKDLKDLLDAWLFRPRSEQLENVDSPLGRHRALEEYDEKVLFDKSVAVLEQLSNLKFCLNAYQEKQQQLQSSPFHVGQKIREKLFKENPNDAVEIVAEEAFQKACTVQLLCAKDTKISLEAHQSLCLEITGAKFGILFLREDLKPYASNSPFSFDRCINQDRAITLENALDFLELMLNKLTQEREALNHSFHTAHTTTDEIEDRLQEIRRQIFLFNELDVLSRSCTLYLLSKDLLMLQDEASTLMDIKIHKSIYTCVQVLEHYINEGNRKGWTLKFFNQIAEILKHAPRDYPRGLLENRISIITDAEKRAQIQRCLKAMDDAQFSLACVSFLNMRLSKTIRELESNPFTYAAGITSKLKEESDKLLKDSGALLMEVYVRYEHSLQPYTSFLLRNHALYANAEKLHVEENRQQSPELRAVSAMDGFSK